MNALRLQSIGVSSYPNQHPIVRENVVLLRRDEGKEPSLVSYIVSDLKNKWQEWQQEMRTPVLPGDVSVLLSAPQNEAIQN